MASSCSYELSQCAYIKLVLHALKNPSASVNGVLTGRLRDGSGAGDVVEISDAVPISHSKIGILPALELALIQVEEHFSSENATVVGYYHANERYDDTVLGGAARKIGDHVFRYFPRAAVLLIDNKKLEALQKVKGREAVVQLYTRDSSKSWHLAEPDEHSKLILKEPGSNLVLLDYISAEKWQEIVDFDDHLDDISKDWLNPNLFK